VQHWIVFPAAILMSFSHRRGRTEGGGEKKKKKVAIFFWALRMLNANTVGAKIACRKKEERKKKKKQHTGGGLKDIDEFCAQREWGEKGRLLLSSAKYGHFFLFPAAAGLLTPPAERGEEEERRRPK